MTSFAKRAFHGTVLVIMLGMVSNVLAYVLRLVLARWLSQEDFGLFYAIVAVVGLLYIVTHLGLNDALTRHISASRVRNDQSSIKEGIVWVLLIQIIIAIIVVSIIAVISKWMGGHYFNHPKAAIVFVIHSLGMVLLPFETVFLSIFQGYQRMLWYSSVNVLRMTSVVLFTVLYLYSGLGVLAPALGYLSWYVIAIAVYAPVMLKSVIPDFFVTPYRLTSGLVKELFAFGLPVTFSSFAAVIISYTDTIMLTGIRKSLQEVAIYNVALPTASVLWFFAAGLGIVLFPITSELWERKYHDHLKDGIELVYRYSFMAILPLALSVAVFPDVVLRTLFGAGFESGAMPLQILGLGGILFMFGRINEAFFSGMNMPRVNSRIVWFGAVVNVIGNGALIPSFGMVGAAIGTVFSFASIFAMGLFYIRKHIQFKTPWISWCKTGFAGVIFVILLDWLKDAIPLPFWPKIISGTLLAFVAYTIVLLLTKALTIDELKSQIKRVW